MKKFLIPEELSFMISSRKSPFLFFFFLFLFSISSRAQKVEDEKDICFVAIGFYGGTNVGKWKELPIFPSDIHGTIENLKGKRYFGPTFGVGADWKFSKYIGTYFSVCIHAHRVICAQRDSYGSSDWVYANSDSSARVIGPFTEAAWFRYEDVAMLIGPKFYWPFKNGFSVNYYPGLCYHLWNVGVYNEALDFNWSNTSGHSVTIQYLNFAIEKHFKKKRYLLSAYFEAGSTVPETEWKDLFFPGWNYSVNKNHAMGLYRFGLSFKLLLGKMKAE